MIRKYQESRFEYEYKLLSRLQTDCLYVINKARHTKHLWGDSVEVHINKMIELYYLITSKEGPNSITNLNMEMIEYYERELLKIEKSQRESVENTFTIDEEVRITQDNHDIFLEKGDRIRVIKEEEKYWIVNYNLMGMEVFGDDYNVYFTDRGKAERKLDIVQKDNPSAFLTTQDPDSL